MVIERAGRVMAQVVDSGAETSARDDAERQEDTRGVEDAVTEDAAMVPTWAKYIVLSRHVSDLPMRDKRMVFTHMRNIEGCTSDWFIPRLGMTMGEFCVFHILGANSRQANAGGASAS